MTRLWRVLVLAALVWALALGVAEAKAHHPPPPEKGGWTQISLPDGALD